MGNITSIVLCGVGGQGSLRAGEIIARAAILSDLQVSTSEVHGMAQRGGAVFSTTRFGEEVYSPVVTKGEAKYLLSFEKLEALRYLDYLAPDGIALVNDQGIMPTIQALKSAPYPGDFKARLDATGLRSYLVPGLDIAIEIGNPRLVNSVLLGALSVYEPMKKGAWERAISQLVPPKTVDLNLRAFEEGRDFINKTESEAGAVAP